MSHLTLLRKFTILIIVKTKIMISFDIDNLYSNIPVNKEVDITLSMLYNRPSLPPILINCSQFRHLFKNSHLR